MATNEATPTESTEIINPAENLTGWLDQRDAKAAAANDSPAEPTVAEPATPTQPAVDWREVQLPEDVDHGFFRGKKVGVLYESYKHAETAKQAAERERNELKTRLDKLEREREAEAAARKVASESRPAVQPTDPDAEITALLLENPQAGIKRLREQATEEARRAAEAETAKYRQETQQETYKRQVYEAGTKAYAEAQKALNLDNETWAKRSKAVLVELTDQSSPYYGDGQNVFRHDAYVQVYQDLFGSPAPVAPVVVKQTPELPTPPGAKRPVSASVPEPSPSPLTQEQIEVRKRWASIAGIDPKDLIARGEKRKERARG